MRWVTFIGIFVLGFQASGQNAAATLWNDLKAKRDAYSGIHQEFDVVKTSQTAFNQQSSKWQVTIDIAGRKWRETRAGLASPVRVFDGKDSFSFEEGEKEYVRVKHGKNDNPMPSPYDYENLDWSKASERQRLQCKLDGENHECVDLEIPIKPWVKLGKYHETRLSQGVAQAVLDIQTGLLLRSRIVEDITGEQCTCRQDTQYAEKAQAYSTAPATSLFVLPPEFTAEVKELPLWDAVRIKKTLLGKTAPDLTVTELSGSRLDLSRLKGKTVLLDFWASWCPPCRADGPSLRKLYQRYGGKELEIVAIDVAEDRATVQKYLKDHPAGYPVVLSTENALPRPYEPNVIPTYVVIGADGLVQGATQDQQGFFDLRELLKKAGWEMN